ncbi:MAG: AAA family ATPase, partial [Deltaproteobacteria bacterium]|nr:AAA family ATPase [Deltaproteobacteria bacterium]
MLELPSAGQTFSKIRKNNFLYVDKTKFLYPIIKKEGCFFLSRPRRFGKSMLLDTLRELLKGKRDLFKGLWIDQSDYDFKP